MFWRAPRGTVSRGMVKVWFQKPHSIQIMKIIGFFREKFTVKILPQTPFLSCTYSRGDFPQV